MLNPATPAQAQVVAQRVLGNWTFYYQIWNAIAFSITEKDKWAQITYNTRNRTVNVNVVLAWGHALAERYREHSRFLSIVQARRAATITRAPPVRLWRAGPGVVAE